MKGSFPTYFTQTTQALFNTWRDTIQAGTVSNLHDWRVQMKKMKAIISFLQWIYGKSSLGKLPNSSRELFIQAGEWRELQLLHQWLQKEKLPLAALLKCTEKDIEQAADSTQNVFQKKLDDYNKQLKKTALLVNKTHSILADQYWLQLSTTLKKELKKGKKKDWHSTRKLCKKWLYACNWLEINSLPDKKQIQSIIQLEKLIGHWHECIMLLDRLEEITYLDKEPLETRKILAIAIARVLKKEKAMEKKTREQFIITAEKFYVSALPVKKSRNQKPESLIVRS